MWAAGALRGAPASTTRTLRRARDSTRAADRPAAPPPMTDYVVLTHASKAGAARPVRLRTLLFLGNGSQMSLVEDTSAAAIAAALDQVGARLKRLRTQRRLTLTGVATATGISKSTLSRLETGQRRPTLELLLALSHAYRVPLDDLVGAPEEGDPRLRLKPGRSRAGR